MQRTLPPLEELSKQCNTNKKNVEQFLNHLQQFAANPDDQKLQTYVKELAQILISGQQKVRTHSSVVADHHRNFRAVETLKKKQAETQAKITKYAFYLQQLDQDAKEILKKPNLMHNHKGEFKSQTFTVTQAKTLSQRLRFMSATRTDDPEMECSRWIAPYPPPEQVAFSFLHNQNEWGKESVLDPKPEETPDPNTVEETGITEIEEDDDDEFGFDDF